MFFFHGRCISIAGNTYSSMQCFLSIDQREAFNLFDKRGDGKVDSNQLGDILRALGLNPTEADVAKIRKDLDPTGNKTVHLEIVKSN